MLRILVFLPFLVVSNALDFLNVNLQKQVNLSTDQRAFVVNVSISWLNKPPYIYNEKDPKTEFQFEAKDSRKDDQTKGNIKNAKVKGIFYEVVNKGLQICGVIHSEGTKYSTNAAEDLQQLDQTIVQKKADIAMPVHGSEEGKYGGYEYVEVLKSPGVVFIVNRQETQQHSRNRVLQAMKHTWPVIVITLLMTGLAGLFIWGLDTSGNPDHFPRSFTRGVMEGVWWSFVSMTTVGYGDRIPKSYLARLFGILWILTGLVLCSFFTATFTSALTSSSIKQRESLLGAKVAVIADSHAYDEALKHAVNVKDYPNFYQMYDALMEKKEVDGILADIYTASYYMYNIGDSRLAVTMFFRSQRSIGFVTRPEHFFRNVNLECLRNLFKYRQRDIKKIILQNTQVFHNETRNRRLTDDDTDIIVTLLDGDSYWFKSTSLVLLIMFFLILTVGFACESCLATLRKRRVTRPPVKGCLPDSINLTEKLPSCKPNHCRKTSLE